LALSAALHVDPAVNLSPTSAFYRWRQRHFRQAHEHAWFVKDARTEALIRSELARYAYAIELHESGALIPKPLYQRLHFRWDKSHRERLEALLAEQAFTLPCGKRIEPTTDGVRLSMLRQLTSGFIYANGCEDRSDDVCSDTSACHWLSNARIRALSDCVDGVQGPVLVAAFFRAEVDALLSHFGGKAKALNGQTPAAERSKLIDAWNRDAIEVLIGVPAAMGHGINLQHGSCRTLIWYTHSFDWAQRAQMNARLIRAGQTKTVSIIDMVADQGIDVPVLHALEKKKAGEAAMFEAIKAAQGKAAPSTSGAVR
jgi:hypothetical protein